MAATPDGRGYWLVASDGGIFTFGDAAFYGSTGSFKAEPAHRGHGVRPERRRVRPGGGRRGTFGFGSAPFYGSLGGIPLKNPIVAATTTPGDTGYWFSDNAGEVSAFGQASYYGSAPSAPGDPVVGMAEARVPEPSSARRFPPVRTATTSAGST